MVWTRARNGTQPRGVVSAPVSAGRSATSTVHAPATIAPRRHHPTSGVSASSRATATRTPLAVNAASCSANRPDPTRS